MNLGGPVWHASGRGIDPFQSRRIALAALHGVGDPKLGQWEERGNGGVYHVRRRLSVEEQKVVGEARDIRNTAEEHERIDRLLDAVHPLVARQITAMRLAGASRAETAR
jgi:hypothetical protein